MRRRLWRGEVGGRMPLAGNAMAFDPQDPLLEEDQPADQSNLVFSIRCLLNRKTSGETDARQTALDYKELVLIQPGRYQYSGV